MKRPNAEMGVWSPDDPLPHKKPRSVWRWMLDMLVLGILAIALMSCQSIHPQSGLVEVRWLETVPEGAGCVSPGLFKAIAGSAPDAEWKSVGEFKNGCLVAWWQERTW